VERDHPSSCPPFRSPAPPLSPHPLPRCRRPNLLIASRDGRSSLISRGRLSRILQSGENAEGRSLRFRNLDDAEDDVKSPATRAIPLGYLAKAEQNRPVPRPAPLSRRTSRFVAPTPTPLRFALTDRWLRGDYGNVVASRKSARNKRRNGATSDRSADGSRRKIAANASCISGAYLSLSPSCCFIVELKDASVAITGQLPTFA